MKVDIFNTDKKYQIIYADPPEQPIKKHLRILLGGSPCTHWSIAQKNNRETEPSGLGWELFKNFLIAKEKFKPDYFLYENNKSMAKAIRDQIDIEFNRPYSESPDWELLWEQASDKGHTVRWTWQNRVTGKTEYITRILINSALVSAQNRNRYYWTNIPGVEQPADRGILLKDILESGTNEKGYALNEPVKYLNDKNMEHLMRPFGSKGKIVTKQTPKAPTLMAAMGAGGGNGIYYAENIAEPIPVNDVNGKAGTIRATCYKDGIRNLVGNNIDRKTCVAEPIRIGTIESGERSLKSDSQANRVYSPYAKSGLYACPIEHIFDSEVVKEKYCKFADKKGYIPELFNPYNMAEINNKAPTQTAMCDRINSSATVLKFEKSADCKQHPVYEVKNGLITIKDKQYPIKLPDGYYIIRKLTVLECKRLQTVRDDYIMPCSASQNYKMLGNGWTVDVIAHILSHIPDIENCEVEVLSMYDGMSCGNLALEKFGCKINKYISYEIDKYAIQTTQTNFPYVIQKGDAFQVRNYNWKY